MERILSPWIQNPLVVQTRVDNPAGERTMPLAT